MTFSKFQSTHPHGVRLFIELSKKSALWFQSTHPHGVRRCEGCQSETGFRFQSTHPHGVRPPNADVKPRFLVFQSTHPHGVRHNLQGIYDVTENVSIHAPTWGATCVTILSHHRLRSFNPRTHMGCDSSWRTESCGWTFQSTHPHGVRHREGRYHRLGEIGFNPRTHMGCDSDLLKLITAKYAFQSTHPHGVRHNVSISNIRIKSFNPRTHMGCDC